jgi:thymidylate synthase
MFVSYSTLTELYRDTLDHVRLCGTSSHPRGRATVEVVGAHLHLSNARANILFSEERKLNYYFSVAEFLWILLGQSDVASITAFNSKIDQFSDDRVSFSGAYGPRVMEQLPYVVNTLQTDPDTRQAVMTIWRERPGPSKDVPCTISMQFFVRDKRVHAVTYMRSNDVWLGLPYDVFNFTMIQQYVAAAIGYDVGGYHHMVGSLHMYEENHADVVRVIDDRGPRLKNELHVGVYPITYPVPVGVRSLFNGIAHEGREGRLKDREFVLDVLDSIDRNVEHRGWRELMRVLATRWCPMPQLMKDPWDILLTDRFCVVKPKSDVSRS